MPVPETRTRAVTAAQRNPVRNMDPQLLAAVVEKNLGLAYQVAQKWSQRYPGVQREDLEASAVLGLMRALETYEASKGSLSTYAYWWMEAEIRKFLEGEGYQEPSVSLHEPLGEDEEDEGLERVLADSRPLPHEVYDERTSMERVRRFVSAVERVGGEFAPYAKLRIGWQGGPEGGFGADPQLPERVAFFLGLSPRRARALEKRLKDLAKKLLQV